MGTSSPRIVPSDVGLWLPTGRDLEVIAWNIDIKSPPEPQDALSNIASLLAAAGDRSHAAGLLYKLVAAVRPYDRLTELFALEAARVVLIANGFPAARIDRDRAAALWDDMDTGKVTTAREIGARLVDL